jgi:hypothetical protein
MHWKGREEKRKERKNVLSKQNHKFVDLQIWLNFNIK